MKKTDVEAKIRQAHKNMVIPKKQETDSLEGFTGGEWESCQAHTRVWGISVWEVFISGQWIAQVRGDNDETTKANATLIAASKDMYRALKDFMKLVDGISVVPYGAKLTVTIDAELFEKESKAINKATPKK